LKLSKELSLDEISNSDLIKKTRDQFLKGLSVNACESCVKMEGLGNESPRQELNSFFSNKAYSEKDSMKIEYLDISFSNECNMQCLMCSANYSSLWAKEADGNGKKVGVSEEIINSSSFENITRDLKLVLIQGGEPLMSSSHIPFIDHLIEKSNAQDITLDYVTNFSIPITEKLVEKWKKFKEVNLYISLEGIGVTYELTRPPQKWARQEKLFAQIKDLKKEDGLNINLNLKTVIQILNIFDLKNIIEYFKAYSDDLPMIPEFSLIDFPKHLCVSQLNKDKRRDLVQKYRKYLDTLNFDSHKEKNLKNLKTLKNILKTIEAMEEGGVSEKLLFQTKFFEKKYGLKYINLLKKIV
jgi:molybdenum cofactor biosynthesis enzyme MoaA